MSKKSDENLGTVHVAPKAVATIASHALLTSYGVVGMASKNAFNELAATLTHDPHHGIDVRLEQDKIIIDVYVIMQHGTRITSVAESVINAVRFNVEKALGIPVQQVNMYVQGLRLMSNSK
ncbi:MAG: Asp23/Gls24 family envelope stress response protein [Anaerolineae bacterium]|nr:Asp23/Gls24 family envelope stress response protein [Anaerolineae bacterium]